jgi:hypothetical protein
MIPVLLANCARVRGQRYLYSWPTIPALLCKHCMPMPIFYIPKKAIMILNFPASEKYVTHSIKISFIESFQKRQVVWFVIYSKM